MKMLVRVAAAADVPACVEVSASRTDTFFVEKDFLNAINDKDAIYLVAESDGKVVGYIMGYVNPTKNDEAIIQSTMVHASYGNKGIGSMLVKALAKLACVHVVENLFPMFGRLVVGFN